MSTLQVFLFGKFCVRRNEQVLEGFDAHKVQELFCYLLLHRNHPLPRETLAGILWPDMTTYLSKKNLRNTLWRLQSLLDSSYKLSNERLLLVEPEWIQLNSEADLWLDVAVFESAYRQLQALRDQNMNTMTLQMLQSAVQLYQGPLLEGWYEDWCLQERERLQDIYLAMLDILMDYCEIQHQFEMGLQYGMRILCYDRARERTHRRLMRLYYLAGDRTAALRQYERCIEALDEELDIHPSKNTIALYKQIRADQVEGSALASTELSKQLELLTAPLLDILDRLAQMQSELTELHDEVQQKIRAIEDALSPFLRDFAQIKR